MTVIVRIYDIDEVQDGDSFMAFKKSIEGHEVLQLMPLDNVKGEFTLIVEEKWIEAPHDFLLKVGRICRKLDEKGLASRLEFEDMAFDDDAKRILRKAIIKYGPVKELLTNE